MLSPRRSTTNAGGNGLHEQEAEGGVVSEGKQEEEDEAMDEGE